MPYRSKKQRAWMHIHEPEIAERLDEEYGGKIIPSKSKTRRDRQRSKKSRKRQNKIKRKGLNDIYPG